MSRAIKHSVGPDLDRQNVLWLGSHGAVKLNFLVYIRQYTYPNENFEYSYPLNDSCNLNPCHNECFLCTTLLPQFIGPHHQMMAELYRCFPSSCLSSFVHTLTQSFDYHLFSPKFHKLMFINFSPKFEYRFCPVNVNQDGHHLFVCTCGHSNSVICHPTLLSFIFIYILLLSSSGPSSNMRFV